MIFTNTLSGSSGAQDWNTELTAIIKLIRLLPAGR
jgi:hypothetical protein